MNCQLGVDLVEIKRIKLKLGFIHHLLSKEEVLLLEKKITKKEKKEFLAGRWAVKEALYKAGLTTLSFSEMKVLYNDQNQPVLTNEGFSQFVITISHERKYAIGVALSQKLEKQQ